MEVKFFNFQKRIRSTKTPDTLSGHSKDCQLTQGCSVLNPTLLISRDTYDITWNYAYIPKWGRYYNISNHEIIDGMIRLTLSVDVLSTWKNDIAVSPAYIMYAHDVPGGLIPDNRIPCSKNVVIHENTYNLGTYNGQSLPADFFSIQGPNDGALYVISVTGKGSYGDYLITYSDDLPSLLDGVDSFVDNVMKDTLTAFKQVFYGGSAADCLKGCLALPLLFTGMPGDKTSSIVLGSYPCKTGTRDIKGIHLDHKIRRRTFVLTIPWQYSDWRRRTPYTAIYVYLPLIGMLSIPTDDLVNESSITFDYNINVTSGDIAVSYRASSSGRFIGTASGNCAMGVTVGSSGVDVGKSAGAVVTGAAALAATLATGGAAAPVALGAIGAMGASVNSFMQSQGGMTSGQGGLVGGASHALDRYARIWTVSRVLTEEPDKLNDVMGKPYMKRSNIGSFPGGYVQTDGFEVVSGATDTERSQINSYCNSGIYYE